MGVEEGIGSKVPLEKSRASNDDDDDDDDHDDDANTGNEEKVSQNDDNGQGAVTMSSGTTKRRKRPCESRYMYGAALHLDDFNTRKMLSNASILQVTCC